MKEVILHKPGVANSGDKRTEYNRSGDEYTLTASLGFAVGRKGECSLKAVLN